MNNNLGHIGVLMGGYSSERDISLKSGSAIYKALSEKGCNVSEIDINVKEEKQIINLIKKARIDVAFIALHGALGEDGTIQSILERLKIPYTGSGIDASERAIDKVKTQRILKENNIPVPDYEVVRRGDVYDYNLLIQNLKGFPLIVKPAREGSSIGIKVANDWMELSRGIEDALEYGKEVLVERYIKGRELTVGILDEKPLPIVEIRTKNIFFDFTAKYQRGITEYIIPAEISQDIASKIQMMALDAHEVLGCRDLSRVDLILDEGKRPFFLEINTIPGFTSTSLLPMAAKQVGIDFQQLCYRITELAHAKKF